jgi:hypothetical protein
MQLSYRGRFYELEELANSLNEGEIIGKYRGLTTHIGAAESAPQTTVTLHYRGVPYTRSR